MNYYEMIDDYYYHPNLYINTFIHQAVCTEICVLSVVHVVMKIKNLFEIFIQKTNVYIDLFYFQYMMLRMIKNYVFSFFLNLLL